MSGWGLRTEDIRDGYAHDSGCREAYWPEAYEWIVSEGYAQFDRWLADYTRAVKAEAWDEGFDAAERDVMQHKTWDEPCIENPYRKAE